MAEFHVRLRCSACRNDTLVNLTGFTSYRASLVRKRMREPQECGICRAVAMTGVVDPGAAEDAVTTVRDAPSTWTTEQVQDLLNRSRKP